jgi:hypothetical protein
MKKEQLDRLWGFIEKQISRDLESILPWTRQAAIALILDCEPEIVAALIQGSSLPAHAVMDWLARQARLIPTVDQIRVDQLRRCLEGGYLETPREAPPADQRDELALRRDRNFARKIWDALEKNIIAMDSGSEFNPELLEAARAAMAMMYECHPRLIVECIENSPLPTRALVSWLIFEGQRMPVLDPSRVRALKDYWEKRREGQVIPSPETSAAPPAAVPA